MRKIGIIVAVLALSIGTWFFIQKTSDKVAQNSPASESTSTSPANSEATANNQPSSPAEAPPQSEVVASKSDTEVNPTAGTASDLPAGTATGMSAGAAAGPGAVTAPSQAVASESSNLNAPKEIIPAKEGASTGSAPKNPFAVAPAKVADPGKSSAPNAPVAKSEPAKNCHTFEYRHQESAKSKDIESFLDFSNAFPLAAENVNKKSICVKVNQKPVEFQVLKLKGKEEIVIGPVVGPESIIRVSYCTGAAQCREACVPQKKRFMDDLLSDAQADDFQDSWGKAGADSNSQELKAKTKELQSLARTNSGLNDRAMMRDWNTLQKQEWTCNQK
jgi:hypothetical protein